MERAPFHREDKVGAYRVGDILSVGPMGLVYEIIDRPLLLKAPFVDSGKMVEKFCKEVQVLKNVSHPGMIGILEWDLEGNIPWCLLPKLPSKTLRFCMKQARPVLVREATQWVLQIAQTLTFLHTKPEPILHRHLRPEHIAIHQGKAILLDTGLTDFGSSSGSFCLPQADFLYDPPEQMDMRGKLDIKAEIYSLGVIFYELLGGNPPYGKIEECCYEANRCLFRERTIDLQFPIPPIRELPKLLPRILQKTLQREKKLRYSDAEEMALDLKKALKDILYQEAKKAEQNENFPKAITLAQDAINYGAEDPYFQELILKKAKLPPEDLPLGDFSTFRDAFTALESALGRHGQAQEEKQKEKYQQVLDHQLGIDTSLESKQIFCTQWQRVQTMLAKWLPFPSVPQVETRAIEPTRPAEKEPMAPSEPVAKEKSPEKEEAFLSEGMLETVSQEEFAQVESMIMLSEQEMSHEPEPEIHHDLEQDSGHDSEPEIRQEAVPDPAPQAVVLPETKSVGEKPTPEGLAILEKKIEICEEEGNLFEDLSPALAFEDLEEATVTVKQTISLPKGFQWISERTIRCEKDHSEMVYIPAGTFIMGSDALYAFDMEKPEHEVYLNDFFIDKYPISWEQYLQFCKETNYADPKAPRWGICLDHPVVNIHWNDAKAYGTWANKDLPTEAQWEKSARGGIWLAGDILKQNKNEKTRRKFPWGDEAPNAAGVWRANYNDEPRYGNNHGKKSTSPVGQFPMGASPYGVMDLSGNVWEWTRDWFQSDYYRHSPSQNPLGPQLIEKKESSAQAASRVLRGGSWYVGSRFLRTSVRRRRPPEEKGASCGMRCVLTIA